MYVTSRMKYRRLYMGARMYDITLLCDRDRSRCRALGGARSGSPQLANFFSFSFSLLITHPSRGSMPLLVSFALLPRGGGYEVATEIVRLAREEHSRLFELCTLPCCCKTCTCIHTYNVIWCIYIQQYTL